MGSPQPQLVVQKPHAVCLPFPVQGHIKPMLDLAKLLHSRGFYITFINTEFNQRRLIKSGALNPTVQIDGFRFETIPDGLDTPEMDATQNVRDLAYSTSKRCLGPLKQLIERLNGDSECGLPISFMIRDASMRFAQRLDLGMVDVTLWTMSACSYMGILHYEELIRRGYIPFKDADWFSNGYLDTPIDWIPAMPNIRLKDLPTFIRTTDPNDLLLNYGKREPQAASSTSAVLINTFEELDHDLISAIGDKFTKRRPYALRPLSALSQHIPNTSKLNCIKPNLWKEEMECVEWLNTRSAASVVYVNFGSIVELTPEQLNEFAWGLAESKHPFLWVIRPDIVTGDLAVWEGNFVVETQGRGLIVGWCPQKEVLSHPSVGGFLSHCGWNSTIESISSGVPMLCWPFFADQQTNCRYICSVWGVGMEIDCEVKREEVKSLIRELMEGEKGKEIRKKAMEWKESARKATELGGSSHCNFEGFLNDLLAMKS